jgi:transcriptional regulator with XRE-family HTH domain
VDGVPFSASLYENFPVAMNYFKHLRKKSNKDISDALGLPSSTVSSWNTGKHLPDMDRLQRLAEYLDAPIEQFFKFSPEYPKDSELITLHNIIDTDTELRNFVKLYSSLSAENKHLITLLTHKIAKSQD